MFDEKILKGLVGPHITEKGTALGGKNIYVFRVQSSINKLIVKKAVEAIFQVTVKSVRICNVMRKNKRRGNQGKKSVARKRQDWKKVYVKIEKGQTISFF